MSNNIKLVFYDPNWPLIFENEAILLQEALGSNCIAIHHIGSTSVPGLNAKPIIDIIPVVKNILEVDNANSEMKRIGYTAKGEHGIAFRRFFQKGLPITTHNVHVYEEFDPEINRYLKFRDWMRLHSDDAQEYAELKIALAKKFPDDILNYCLGKDAFVANIDVKDGFNGWRMVQALTDREWKAVHTLRGQYFLNTTRFPESFKDKNHIHFLFYKNSDIIGYAHIQLYDKDSATLLILVIDSLCQNLGFEDQFLKLCQRWVLHQGIKQLEI